MCTGGSRLSSGWVSVTDSHLWARAASLSLVGQDSRQLLMGERLKSSVSLGLLGPSAGVRGSFGFLLP